MIWIWGWKSTKKFVVYILIISAKMSRYKTDLSTKICSGGRKGYPIWFKNSRNQSQGIPHTELICLFLRIHSHFRWYHNHSIYAGKILHQII